SLGRQDDAHICVLTLGPMSETYFEHAYLARYLGFLMVEGADLSVRDDGVFVRTVSGLQRTEVCCAGSTPTSPIRWSSTPPRGWARPVFYKPCATARSLSQMRSAPASSKRVPCWPSCPRWRAASLALNWQSRMLRHGGSAKPTCAKRSSKSSTAW